MIRPGDGEVLALAGIAYSAPQPPGSVFKIVTLAGALDAGVAKRSGSYPVQTAAVLEGVELENANGESCGGSLQTQLRPLLQLGLRPDGRASSAPSGSWRRPSASASTRIPGWPARCARRSRRRARSATTSPSGSTAIGQGKVLATPLLMAGIAGAIAEGGLRVRPTLRKGAAPERTRAVPEPVARTDRDVHARGRHVRDRRERRDPRREGRRQDRHRGAARHDERRPGPRTTRTRRRPRTRPTRTRGSRPTRRCAGRAWRSR